MRVAPVGLGLLFVTLVVSCSSDPSPAEAPTTTDAGGRDLAVTPEPDSGTGTNDAGADTGGGPLTEQSEVEPNDGKTATEIGAMALPGQMTGKLDPANEIDIFGVSLTPGDFYEWTLTPTGGDLTPHITVFDTTPNNLNPTALVAGTTKGAPITLQHFVLRSGTFVAAVRDSRNVPTGTGVGGPTFGYTLVGRTKAAAPVAVTFPSTKTGKLASLGAVDLYTFTTTNGKGFDIVLRAERKAQPSTLDSRLSLFDITKKQTIITNDNAAGTTDSQIGSSNGVTGSYMIIVDNEGTNAADLSYELELSLRP
jgi:hypothetical protein